MVNVEVTKEMYTVELLRNNPDKIFVFGDNSVRKGKKGQAVVRDEPNAYGIATKTYPSLRYDAFFSDKDEEFKLVEEDLLELLRKAEAPNAPTVVFPYWGIGTGLANMKSRSPKLWEHLCSLLQEYFDFENNPYVKQNQS